MSRWSVGRPPPRESTSLRTSRATAVLLLGVLAGCGPGDPGNGDPAAADAAPAAPAAEPILEREIARIDARAAAIDSIFQPLPLLTPAQEAGLRRFPNAQQLARSRVVGVGRNLPAERLRALEQEGRLVTLEDSRYWVVRDMDYSQPLAVPAVHDFLTALGERFHSRLADLGAPPLRFEISSVLRTAADQEALRQVNPNAALGESTHEYGTTLDILYSAFSAPLDPIVELDSSVAPWALTFLDRYATVAVERVAGRRALELKAILGNVLFEMQQEGRVMVTIERQQPVYHMTVTGQ